MSLGISQAWDILVAGGSAKDALAALFSSVQSPVDFFTDLINYLRDILGVPEAE